MNLSLISIVALFASCCLAEHHAVPPRADQAKHTRSNAPQTKDATQKKFDRVLVTSGGGFNTAVFLGMLAGLKEKGWVPDVLITTCGSSIAAAIVNRFPDNPAAWKNYIESDEFYRLMKSPRINSDASVVNQLVPAIIKPKTSQTQSAIDGDQKIPNLFSNHLLFVPLNLAINAPTLDVPFEPSKTRAVMIAARVLFDASHVGNDRRAQKLFQEVYFTDLDTAQCLIGLDSAVGRCFEDSAVDKQTRIISDCKLTIGARTSFSDPYYMNPMEINGEHYLAGSINLYPLEVAEHLSQKDVIATANGGFNSIEQMAINTSFGYDNNARLRQVMDKKATHWIDITDDPPQSLNPKPVISTKEISLRKIFTRIDALEVGRLIQLKSNVPDDHKEFLKAVAAQWEFGKARAIEAIQTKENSKIHLRKLDELNASKKLLESVRKERAMPRFSTGQAP